MNNSSGLHVYLTDTILSRKDSLYNSTYLREYILQNVSAEYFPLKLTLGSNTGFLFCCLFF